MKGCDCGFARVQAAKERISKIAQKIAGDLQGRDLLLRSSELQRPKFKAERERARIVTRNCVAERIDTHLAPTLALMDRLAAAATQKKPKWHYDLCPARFHAEDSCECGQDELYAVLAEAEAHKKERG